MKPPMASVDRLESRGMARRLASAMVLALTSLRLVLAVIFPASPVSWWLPIIAGAGISDLLDGWLGRRLRVTSVAGQVLDPVADKVFMASVLLTCCHAGLCPAWQFPLVGFRDLAVAVGSAREAIRHGWQVLAVMHPSRLGKLTTAAQFVFLAAVLYHRPSVPYALVLAASLSLLSGSGYLMRWPAQTPRSVC
jgi:CDP-diacylglycerol--glycerol-3-phosphate 3-phosphatidyltransferase